jgi:hypothetical protein
MALAPSSSIRHFTVSKYPNSAAKCKVAQIVDKQTFVDVGTSLLDQSLNDVDFPKLCGYVQGSITVEHS